MLKRAASLGSSGAEQDLAQLYLAGGPGVAADRAESLKWFESAARHGDRESMLTLGYLALNAGRSAGGKDVVRGFCWLMRAALLDGPQAQEKLSTLFASGESDDRGGAIGADLVQADLWFRLAARSPYHDNSQIRATIEANMTTEQIDAARRLVDAWRPRSFEDLKTLEIAAPAGSRGGDPARPCPPMG
jgi:TPR repeat protein